MPQQPKLIQVDASLILDLQSIGSSPERNINVNLDICSDAELESKDQCPIRKMAHIEVLL